MPTLQGVSYAKSEPREIDVNIDIDGVRVKLKAQKPGSRSGRSVTAQLIELQAAVRNGAGRDEDLWAIRLVPEGLLITIPASGEGCWETVVSRADFQEALE